MAKRPQDSKRSGGEKRGFGAAKEDLQIPTLFLLRLLKQERNQDKSGMNALEIYAAG
jgi:hypothetical protein